MLIDHTALMPFLKELITLSPKQQEIFLFCLENLPHPVNNSGDLERIRTAVGCKHRTLQVALLVINNTQILSQLVKYRRTSLRSMKNGIQ